jgi:hypothetical protein
MALEISPEEGIITMKKTKPIAATPPAAAPAEPAAPQLTLNPMQVSILGLSPKQEQEVRKALLSLLHRRLDGMSACTLRSLVWYADIEDADGGCFTPAEDFITRLVLHHHVRALTPDDATNHLETFRENFDSVVEGARNFSAMYPEAVKPATAA